MNIYPVPIKIHPHSFEIFSGVSDMFSLTEKHRILLNQNRVFQSVSDVTIDSSLLWAQVKHTSFPACMQNFGLRLVRSATSKGFNLGNIRLFIRETLYDFYAPLSIFSELVYICFILLFPQCFYCHLLITTKCIFIFYLNWWIIWNALFVLKTWFERSINTFFILLFE